MVTTLGLSAQSSPPRYAEGQVWEYHTRPPDAGSLLKIQRITVLGSEKVYHLSVVGIHFRAAGLLGTLPHTPVSEKTLNASVTTQSHSNAAFPTSAVDEGIAEWRRAQGGIFTIPVAEIIEIADDQTSKNMPAN